MRIRLLNRDYTVVSQHEALPPAGAQRLAERRAGGGERAACARLIRNRRAVPALQVTCEAITLVTFHSSVIISRDPAPIADNIAGLTSLLPKRILLFNRAI
jgi:hypothetical protein